MGLYCRSNADEVNLWGGEGFDFPTVQARDCYIFRTGQIPAGRRRHYCCSLLLQVNLCYSCLFWEGIFQKVPSTMGFIMSNVEFFSNSSVLAGKNGSANFTV